jgi:PTS system mannose-specific IIC component
MDAGFITYSAYSFFFALLALGRAALALVFFRHPLFAGLIWWLVTGELTAVYAAIFFELAWLDLFYVGTYVPPNAMLGYLVYLPLTLCFNLQIPQHSLLLLILCLPLPALGAKVEIWQRTRYGALAYHALVNAVNSEHNIAGVLNKVINRYIACWIIIAAALYFFCSGFMFFALWLLGVFLQAWPAYWFANAHLVYDPYNLTSVINNWGPIWAAGSIGALLSLRIRLAKVCFLAGAVGVAVVLLC